jgi:hypothetical protein
MKHGLRIIDGTPYSERLADLRDSCAGKTVVLIGNGPSLNQIDWSQINHLDLFGVNKIYLGLEKYGIKLACYASVNDHVIEQSQSQIKSLDCIKFLGDSGNRGLIEEHGSTYLVNTKRPPSPFSTDIALGAECGYTVLYFSMQVIYSLGYKNVLIIGMDHNFKCRGEPNAEQVVDFVDPNHFLPGYFAQGQTWNLPDLEQSEIHYKLAKREFEAAGRQIIDCTPGGLCSIFTKKSLSEALNSLDPPKSFSLSTQIKPPSMPNSPLSTIDPDQSLALEVARLIRRHEEAKAINLIQKGKRSGDHRFQHSFFDFLLDKLSKPGFGAKQSKLQHQTPFSTAQLKNSLSHDLPEKFKAAVSANSDCIYQPSEQLASNKIVADILKAETIESLEKALPYKGKIYLPTNKYTIDKQIAGIKKTAAFLSSENAKATKARLEIIKEYIEEQGITKCLIVANGPSLKSTNVSMIEDHFVIGLNSIFLHPYITPHLIVCEDHLVGEDRSEELNGQKGSIKVVPGYLTYCVEPDDLTIVLNHRPRISFPVDIDFSPNIENLTYTGGTVTYSALQIAVGLGFKQINLVGVDASYKVVNVQEQKDYSTGILESLGDDPNHFNSSYFGKGYRWHDPNPLRMMQAYSVAERYASTNGININNLTRGGMLDVFRRKDFMDSVHNNYPKACIVDWIDITSNAATGEVKRVLFKDWPKNKLISIYSPNTELATPFKSAFGDIYKCDRPSLLSAWKAIIEYGPDIFYFRPTHNRPILNLFTVLVLALGQHPFAFHIMDYWTVKVQDAELAESYEDAIAELYRQAAHIFVISQRMKLRIESRYQLNPSLVSVAHNYVPTTPPDIFLDKESKNPGELTIFYSGNLDPDQSIDPLLDICKAIEILNAKSLKKYVFIVRTSSYHIKNSGHVFADMPFVKLEEQSGDFNAYLADSMSADLCLVCYGFGADSRRYLLDSMANKLPDLLTVKAKFLGYGDPEIGTLAYLSACRFPFLDFTRDVNILANKIEELASMTREDFIEACGESIGTMSNEFSEMAQCHVFQRQLASAADTDVAPSTKLVEKFTQILKLSQQKISDPTQRELNLMGALVGHRELINNVYTLVREHGIDWSVNSSRSELEKNIKSMPTDSNLQAKVIAWMIVSQQHERFAALWLKFYEVILPCLNK